MEWLKANRCFKAMKTFSSHTGSSVAKGDSNQDFQKANSCFHIAIKWHTLFVTELHGLPSLKCSDQQGVATNFPRHRALTLQYCDLFSFHTMITL